MVQAQVSGLIIIQYLSFLIFPLDYLTFCIPTGTQALVRAGSNHSSISIEEPDPSPTDQIVGRARALVDHTPSPYDKEALKFKASH